MTLVFGAVTLMLVALNFTLRRCSTPRPATRTGMTGVLPAFVVMGALIEGRGT